MTQAALESKMLHLILFGNFPDSATSVMVEIHQSWQSQHRGCHQRLPPETPRMEPTYFCSTWTCNILAARNNQRNHRFHAWQKNSTGLGQAICERLSPKNVSLLIKLPCGGLSCTKVINATVWYNGFSDYIYNSIYICIQYLYILYI